MFQKNFQMKFYLTDSEDTLPTSGEFLAVDSDDGKYNIIVQL